MPQHPGAVSEVSQPFAHKRESTKKIWEIINVANLPEMIPSNLRKLRAAYRHPFEYINPRLYQKRTLKSSDTTDEGASAKFFVDNEEEFQALQGDEANTVETSKRSEL